MEEKIYKEVEKLLKEKIQNVYSEVRKKYEIRNESQGIEIGVKETRYTRKLAKVMTKTLMTEKIEEEEKMYF